MKRIFTLLFLTLFFGLSASAQRSYVNYSRDSKWFFGINGGATWHSRTEVDNLLGGGYGFTFGRSFGMKPEKLFSWDLRLRYLHGWWGGQNTIETPLDSNNLGNFPTALPSSTMQSYANNGGYIPNFRTQLISGSLELALNTNRLRENTGWNIQIFGGIGAKGYNTATDLVDGSGQIYDYTGVDNTKTALQDYRDKIYETELTSGFDFDWAGSFGAGISYQVAPWLSLGLSHKMTWVRDNTKFDFMPNDVGGIPTGNNDIYHYSSAGLKFHLFGGNSGTINDHIVEDTTNINNFDPVDDPVVNPVVTQRPIVDIYDPGVSPYTVEYDHFNLRAYVHHVNGKQNITFKQNGGVSNNFTYNPTSDQFASYVKLQPGQNIFEITGRNDAGQDYESTIIIYKPEEPVIEPPIVTITNPSYSPYTTPNSSFAFASTVLNVDSKSQIKVYFNGQYLPNFTYSTSSKKLYATLNLQEGPNTVTVTATNVAGSDSKTTTIIYEKPIERQPPIVNFVNPSVDPYVSANPYTNVTASVLNVDGKANIKVKVNGNYITNFSYNISTKYVNFNMALQEGANVIEVTGTNEVGSDYDNTTIVYKKPETPKPPIVTFLDPAINPIVVYNQTYPVTAKVLNVNSASDITLKINGVQSYNFAYSPSSKEMTFTTNLLQGSNVIEITGTNQYGSDQETTTIIYKKPVPQTPPVVNITYPAQDNQVYATPNLTLTATVLHVNSASSITVNVNGNQVYNFTYNTITKILNLPLILVEGTNTVVITGTNSDGSDSDTRVIIHKRPQVPAPPTVDFTNPPTSPYVVNNENYTVTANTTNIDTKAQIDLLHNGNLIPDAQYTFTSSHQVIYNSQLIPGSNIFEIVVSNADGSASDMAIVTYKIDDEPCIIPTVGYISPVPYSTVNDPNVTIDAQINNHSTETVVELLLNGVSKGFMTYNSNTSIASLPAILSEGSNAVTVIVTNNCGTNQATFTINYKKPEAPCVDPTVVANDPVSQTTQTTTISLSAGVSEVTDQSNLSVTLNGSPIPFTFDQGTGTVTITNANLALGNNNIAITATNDCGTATLNYNIIREACNNPTITNPSHNTGHTTSDASLNFTVKIANANANGIELLINNISQSFNYNAQTQTLSANVDLNVGANTVLVNATNPCGTSTKTYSFVREIPCENIGYSLLSPASQSTTVTDPNYNILLHVTGTFASSGLSATLNGSAISATYDDVAGNVAINGITLLDGTNTIVINLSNDCSSETVTLTINYDGCQPPVINIPSLNNGAVLNTSTVDFSAAIQNSNGAGNIQLLLNGVTQSFDFNDQTNLLTATLNLNEGSNTIKVIVNGCETKSQTLTVTYEEPCVPITYNLMQPSTNSETVVDAAYNVSLALQHVENQQQITATLNGTAVPFTFDNGTGIVTISNITLVDGSNVIVVSASNDCSNETITYNVQYNGCQPPVITLGSNASSVTAALYTFTASVTNITNQSNIQVLVNGAPISFVFQNGNISGEATLNEGANNIVINANGCETASKNFTVTYTIPCQPPVIGITSANTTETSTYNLTASVSNVQGQGDIVVKLNNQTVPFTYSNGTVTASLTLNPGANTIVIEASGCENKSQTTTVTFNEPGPCGPRFNPGNSEWQFCLVTPSGTYNRDDLANNNNFTYVGPATAAYFKPIAGGGDAIVNGQAYPVQNGQYYLFQGNLTVDVSSSHPGSMGHWEICIEADNIPTFGNGNNRPTSPCEAPPCNPPTISVANATVTTQDPIYTFTSNVQNVNSGNDITVKVNGQTVSSNYSSNVLTAQMTLQEGPNEIKVIANGCDTITGTYSVIYQLPCDPPSISITSGASTQASAYTFTATVSNIQAQGDITVKLNNQPVAFTYNSGNLSASMTLVEGANNIQVIANGCEPSTATHTVNYTAPCDPPVVNITSGASAQANPYAFTATVTNVQSQGDIIVKLNNQAVSFTYNNGNVSTNMALIEGANNIEVIANGCQTTNATKTVNYLAPCDPPVVTITSGATSQANPYALTATVSNVQAQGDITVKLNNQTIPFTYNNGNVTASLTLTEGANNIEVVANGCQTTNVNKTVNYTAPAGPCGPRFNPGNAEWQFCLVTPNGTFNRDDLANNNSFSYSGAATAAYFKPIAGGGDAIVNGQAYPVQNGQYYLFQGNLTVDVSSNHPGSMGHWEICIESNAAPTFGNGNNRPTSPCEAAPCNPPVINITSGTTSQTDAYTLTATVSNVQGQGDITVKLNNQTVPFTYSNGSISANLTLNAGANNVTIEAAGCETKSANATITYQAPSNDVNFNIDNNGGVQVNQTVCATITCLGESVVYNNNQDAFVKLEYSITGGSPWYAFNGGNYVNGGESTTVQVPAGGEIALFAECVNANGNWTHTEVSNSGSQYVYVLKNGDQAPNFAPAQGQASVETFLAGYVDSQGNVTIGPNDVIYLFELRFVGNYGIDYQDAVMLVSMDPNGTCSPPSNPVRSGGGHTSKQTWLTPIFNSVSPKDPTTTVDKETFALKTKIEHVNDPADVTVTLNGLSVKNAIYNLSTKELNANLALKAGNNTVKVTAVNGNQSKSVTYTINYQQGGFTATDVSPSIRNISPSTTTSSSDQAAFNFRANVENVTDKNQIKLTVNGANVNNFTYNQSTKEVNAVIQLKNGANTVKLVATSGTLNANRTYTINYREPVVLAPKITNVNPRTTSDSSPTGTYAFKVKVENVNSKSDISLTVNGSAYNTFSYSTASKQVSAVFKLNSGVNTIKVSAVNGGKKAERTYTITVGSSTSGGLGTTTTTTSAKPAITITNPSRTGTTVSSPSYTFKATLKNVENKNNIEIKVNGVSTSGFSYSTSNGQVIAVLRLKSGKNTVYIKATNGKESAEQTIEINYRATNSGGNGFGTGSGGGTTNTGGGKTTNTSGGKTTNTGGGTLNSNSGGTKTTTSGGTKTTNTGSKTTNTGGGILNSNSGGTKTTNSSGTKTTNTGGGTLNSNSTKTTNTGGGTTNTGGSRRGG